MPTDHEKARAEALAVLAARDGLPFEVCPYPLEQRVLRARWAMAYVDAGGLAYIDPGLRRVRDKLRRWWNALDDLHRLAIFPFSHRRWSVAVTAGPCAPHPNDAGDR